MESPSPVQLAEAKESIQQVAGGSDVSRAAHRNPKDEDEGSHQPMSTEHTNLPRKGRRFWAIFPPLCLSQLLIALETSIPTASLPKISADLDAGDEWVWIVNAYLLTNTVFIPIFGESAFVFGRRWPTIFSVAVFVLGSGIAGGATSTAMLIAGRAIQGIGGAGVSVFGNVIISDLTTVRERSKYMAIVFASLGVGLALGPPLGGIMAEHDWRWVFWLNVPIGGFNLVIMFLFLHIDVPRVRSVRQGLGDIDWIGNFLLVGSVVSILIALTWADSRYPWSSWRILVPLLVGFAGLGVFHAYEASSLCAHPTIPPRLFSNRTASVAFLITFFMGIMAVYRTYFLVIYLEGVLMESTARAGVLLLPSVLVYVPASVVGGVVLSKTGRYKPVHGVALAFVILASGLYMDFDENSSLAKVILYQFVAGIGSGMLISTTLPAAQAALSDSESVAASALWAYLRVFGSVWGISVPAAIFNSRFAVESYRISDPALRDVLGQGNAYSHVSGSFVASLPEVLRDEVRSVYTDALRVVWYASMGLSVFTFAFVFLEKEIVMRTSSEVLDKDSSKGETRDLELQVGKDTAQSST